MIFLQRMEQQFKLEPLIIDTVIKACKQLYGHEPEPKLISIQKTNLQFRNEADFTLMVFPLVRLSKKSPELTAKELGDFLKEHLDFVENFNVVKGFLNIKISSKCWLDFLRCHVGAMHYGIQQPDSAQPPVIVEYSSPNTNKPLHLGHIRNNLLGDSISRILKANGKNVVQANLVNDRGIHICKSMLAWQKWGGGETPESSGLKGDKLVGKYYVEFDKHYKEEIRQLVAKGMDEEDAAKAAPLMQQAQEMLRQWEQGTQEVRVLWQMMNSWVYKGFEQTYARLGISFDKIYYESNTYLLGKEVVAEGLNKKVFQKKDDGSVWVDLTSEGLDEKLLLRADGTSVYMTQDLGTACMRYEEFHPEKMIYVVGNEQNYHFDVLKKVLVRAGYNWAENIRHFSYGMVELPEGKMKSREGTVVDADDLIDEVTQSARQITSELGKIDNFESEEAEQLFRMIGLGGLKYFILKVDPVKNMMFNPAESIDFDGNTGPFIQYTHARIKSLLRKSGKNLATLTFDDFADLLNEERELLFLCYDFRRILSLAAEELSPAQIANYVYELAQQYNKFYQRIPVLKDEDANRVDFRLALSFFTANIIRNAMDLLGIFVPEKM
ncbi:MAG TPA: arginine--tRNA ligase [Bacteroidales bacterium]|nr:arginine--tRNA ligase [Bacteroidales bacterium]HPS26954.1 arginine--tRNA ligase [Bacteroidales bacterium]